MMALTEGRLTGRPGVCFVTRGPGATNAAHGVHIAEHNSAPMILFIGQVERAMLGRGAFQEMDYRAFFGSVAKWATEVESRGANPRSRPARLPRRHAGSAGAGGDRAARRHAGRDRRGRRRRARHGDADLARPHADGRAAEDAVERRAADRDPRRPGLDRARERGLRPIRRALRHAGRRLVPPRERLRRRARQFRRRNRARRPIRS